MRDCVILINDKLVSLTHTTWPPANPRLITDCITLSRLNHFGIKSTHQEILLKISASFVATVKVLSASKHHLSGRRGNPMEVIDDCTVFFPGILPNTLPSTGKSSSPSSHFTSNKAREVLHQKKTGSLTPASSARFQAYEERLFPFKVSFLFQHKQMYIHTVSSTSHPTTSDSDINDVSMYYCVLVLLPWLLSEICILSFCIFLFPLSCNIFVFFFFPTV